MSVLETLVLISGALHLLTLIASALAFLYQTLVYDYCALRGG